MSVTARGATGDPDDETPCPRPSPVRLLTVEAARQAIGCSAKILRRRIASGALSVIRDGRLIRIHLEDLQCYIHQPRCG